MLEFIGLIALGYGGWMFFKFWNFRNRLLKTFEVHGISREIANDLYTSHATLINNLHVNDGLTPELIAMVIIESFDNQRL